MNILVCFSFLFVLQLAEVETKSGGGGGRGGGGRGSSGSRSSFSRSRSSGGGKFFSGTSHSTYINHDSTAFRSSVFGRSSSSYFSTGGSSGNTYVISQPATPIIYDNHYYYWHGHYQSRPEKTTMCEYTISEEDGLLMNVTFANGASAQSLQFGCGNWEKCCGLGCCSTVGDYVSMAFIVFILILACAYGFVRE